MKKVNFIAAIILVSMFFIACSGDRSSKSNEQVPPSDLTTDNKSTLTTEEDTFVDNDGSPASGNGEGSGVRKKTVSTANPQVPISLDDAEKTKEEKPAQEVTQRKIIRNANLQLETDNTEESQQKITAIANEKNGFVITSTKQNTNAKAQGLNSVSMQIRVPSEKFQESLEEIRKIADRVIVEKVTGKDVTEEFVDIQARLRTKKALEERYLEIMKRANTVKDALEVERQLAGVRTQIEQIEGRKRFLENQASLSTITIELKTPVELSASSTGFFYELKQAVSDGFETALGFILFLVSFIIAILPFLLFIVLPIFLLLRYFWRKYKKKLTARKIVEDEIKEEKIIDVE